MKATVTLQLILAVFLLALKINAETHYCNETVSCPESAPCCGTAIGECGTGSYCLQCDPRYSYNISACMPNPVCKDLTTTFTVDQVGDYDTYLGNASDYDWVYTGYIMDYDEGMVVAMPNQTSGTVLYSTQYVWYGKVTAKFKSSRGQGVVSAVILYSDVQDEIDYEFVGADLEKVQTNFYYEGVLNYSNSRNISLNNTFEYFHEYTLEWTEDEVIWSVNGEVGRTLKREDTYNETSGEYMFPQTPSKIEISLWPGGDTSNSVGTIDWAGGEIDWNAADLQDPGYLYAILESVEIECYDPPSGTLETGSSAYVYNSSTDFGQDSIMITDDRTYLGSSEATGFDPSYGEEDEDDDDDAYDTTTSTSAIVTTNSAGETTTITSAKVTATGFVQDSSGNSSTSSSQGDAVATSKSQTLIMAVLALLASSLL